ncbi:MAG: HAD family phosphatase [Cyclobacteriaceae bacterium]|nr:HAD family phosphatase [Cyclobacteriaceae bacterium]
MGLWQCLMRSPETIVFDLGGVLIDWNPRYLYRKIFDTEEKVSWFLQHVCTPEWNEKQDGGRTFAEANRELITRFPEYAQAINAWYARWPETIGGPIQGTVNILSKLHQEKEHRLYALTNWSAETFPWAKDHFDFLGWFEGIVVSGDEKMLKPDVAFYQVLLSRYKVIPSKSLFIDDNILNVEGAKAAGMDAIHFTSHQQLKEDLRRKGVSV